MFNTLCTLQVAMYSPCPQGAYILMGEYVFQFFKYLLGTFQK